MILIISTLLADVFNYGKQIFSLITSKNEQILFCLKNKLIIIIGEKSVYLYHVVIREIENIPIDFYFINIY
jgi:hypothetical protein